MKKKTIGIIGCGTIGTAIIEYVKNNLGKYVSDVFLYDVDFDKCMILVKKFENVYIGENVNDTISKSDLIIEAAHPLFVPEFLDSIIEHKKDAMVMSIGGVLGREDILAKAAENEIKIMLPSGAISGIDAIKAFSIAGIDTVSITTRKPPRSLKGAPYLTKNNIDIENISKETLIFEGNALQAIKGFPKNVNVSSLLSIVGIGPEKTKVKIIVSPDFSRNSHEIEVIGNAGKLTTRTENVPSPNNPKTSYLAPLAALAALKEYFSTVRVGT